MELYEIQIMKNNGKKEGDFSKMYIIEESYFKVEEYCKENVPDFISINHIAGESIGNKLYIPKRIICEQKYCMERVVE